jgi:Dockerin type I domain
VPAGPDVTITSEITSPDEPPVDCSSRFVPFVAAGIPCDTNGDGRIDHNDIAAIGAAIGYSVYPGDPRDVDGDGVVTGRDVAACARQCSHAACAP